MKEHHWQTVEGTAPSKSNLYRFGTNGVYKSDKLKQYEERFYWQVGTYRNLNIKGQFEIYVNVFYPSIRSDLDNSLKVLLDCLQHTKTIENDNKCVKILAQKFVDKERPRVEFKIVEID